MIVEIVKLVVPCVLGAVLGWKLLDTVGFMVGEYFEIERKKLGVEDSIAEPVKVDSPLTNFASRFKRSENIADVIAPPHPRNSKEHLDKIFFTPESMKEPSEASKRKLMKRIRGKTCRSCQSWNEKKKMCRRENIPFTSGRCSRWRKTTRGKK